MINELLKLTILVFIAGCFNGQEDSYVWSYDKNVWRVILKGKFLRWYEGEYEQEVAKHLWILPIFRDGWHFFKNSCVGLLLFAIVYAVGNASVLYPMMGHPIWLAVFFFDLAMVWMFGKELNHKYLSKTDFWKLPDPPHKELT